MTPDAPRSAPGPAAPGPAAPGPAARRAGRAGRAGRSTDRDPVLGDAVHAGPGILAVSPWRLREEAACPRRAFYAHVLQLRSAPPEAGSDGAERADLADASLIGRESHAELHARHADPDRHDAPGSVRPDAVADPAVRRAVDRAVRAHVGLCPGSSGSGYLGGEVDLAWFIPRKLVLVTGRIDAWWRTADGTHEIREYKTGRSAADAVADDPAPGIYGLLVAARHPGADVRVVYELLGADTPRPLEIEVTAELRSRSLELVLEMVGRLRSRDPVVAVADPRRCRDCPYRRSCPEGEEAARSAPPR